jgi:DNA-binding transcriptional regulator GbsR (MarR family)
MSLEEIKREFIRYMEEVRSGEPYAKNFMGCLLAIIIEPEPVSQERIANLTKYSQATISLTLQKLQFLMPIRTVRKIGDRKHYYVHDSPPERFVLDLWQMRLKAQTIDIDQIERMIERVGENGSRNSKSVRFYNYLKNLHLYLRIVHELRNMSVAKFEQILETESFENLQVHDAKALQSGKLAKFLENLRSATSDYVGIPNPLYSQVVANQLLVIHDVFLEGTVTQKEIENSTLLPRSTISEVLTSFVKMGIIRVSKKEGSRIKLYQSAISFTDLMLSNYDQLASHISEAMPRLSEFILATRKSHSKSKEGKKFLEILRSLEKAYSFTRDISISMKVEMVARLKEESEKGFVLI